jgi:hypothetical protein
MTRSRFGLSLVLAGAFFVAGCDDKKPDQPKVDQPATPKVATPTTKPSGTTDTPKVDVPKIDAPKVDVPKLDVPSVTPKVDVPKVDTPKVSTPAATAVPADAQTWITKLEEAVKANKLDEAKTYLDKLDAIKDKLPAEWKTKLDAAKAAYDAKKLTGGAGAGSLPGLNK